ncbi:hypothetical protein TUM4630_28150 [Shewanella algidipiscicola]|uniref:Maltose O-acetyltransferase n=1 Tax=Shewanella algidipiscicola TaxID=614070 RepID=A0ABQ4PMG4_9GAMM|nr:hypothetical protein TUM4630_28150 [Shewanella algidipiscicola]
MADIMRLASPKGKGERSNSHATARHPLDAERRLQGWETAKALYIGERVWIGGGAIILPGVTIANEAVIAAGAVVSKDVAA